ncbi:fibrinogen-like YCDxxxxGGGW domain-containing protein [Leucobacter muris]|uniref:fibrinogen-like YCDxxxxGGGW domain-containing protein n=1 Tax=Leucobacter muris TaxID=1935379 RepID=UPI0013E3C295|nr:fibrinogen-like YCDxxxxGGGW domain-containing protein [Leucobacter muris]
MFDNRTPLTGSAPGQRLLRHSAHGRGAPPVNPAVPRPGWRTGRLTAALALAGALAASLLAAPTAAAAADPTPPVIDGLSEATAAASCWEIKQTTPSAPSGVYWLATPAMGGAQQFYCDQERAGGGWVLVGRGRDGWGVANAGSGTPEQVRSAVTGTEAFLPRQLSSELIGQLANNTPIKNLPDGIRLVRATNQQGTSWQELTFTFASPRADWTWQFNNKQRVASYKIGSTTRTGGETSNFGSDNSYNRVRTVTGSNEGWKMGFGFGSQIRGNPAATSYLWSKDTSTGYARPFTQVFIRPQLKSSDIYQAIPDTGTPAVTTTSVADSFALPQPWSVAGIGNGPSSIEGNNEVAAFTEDNGKVYVGGNFTTVQKTAAGGSAQQQSYLAAFNRDTGEWDPAFRPTFNNAIRALATLPGNRIAVGGFFTEVNGEPRDGLAVLNGTTGQLDPQFTGRLINHLSGGFPLVRALDVQDGWLYVGGSFTHGTGGSTTQERYMRAGGRLSVTDGTPDLWNPEFNGTVMAVDASPRGDRAYFAGHFNKSRGRDSDKAAAISATSTDLFTWNVLFSNRSGGRTGYQQAVKEVGDRVWLGGAEHSLFSYSRDDFSLLSTTIGNAGGDFQAIAEYNGVVYGGCHCFETQYEGETRWPEIGTGWTSANAVWGTGAWSASTGERIPQFNGTFSTYRGAGSWALMVDSNGTLWQGGDWSYSTRAGYVRQWTSGFTRHGQRDVTPPETPTALTATGDVTAVSLSWQAAADNTGVTGYEVMRDDRVVATVTGTSAELPPSASGAKYFVRAVDAAGNKSASTAAVLAQEPPETPDTVNYINSGDEWAYLFNAAGPSAGWTGISADTTGWSTGLAPFGWGHAGIATPLSAPAPMPYASFYRKAFEVEDATRVESMEITTRADDGIVVYVNGTEVGRQNVSANPAGVNNYATSSPNAATALANPVTITVPGELLVAGANVVSVSMHSGYRTTPSHSFDLQAIGTLSTEPVRNETVSYVAPASEWAYLYSAAGPSGDWVSAGADTTGWSTGLAPFGWGHAGIATPLSSPAPMPYASFYRKAFEVADATRVESMQVTTRADDGIVVYVNGTEVGRQNVTANPAGVNNYATSSPNAATALANPVTITVPGELLVTGTNVIAVSVHSGYRTTPSHSFELQAIGTVSPTPLRAAVAPPAPLEVPAEAPVEAPAEVAPDATQGGEPAPVAPQAETPTTPTPRVPQSPEETEDPAASSPAVPPVAGGPSPEGWGRFLIAPAPAVPEEE